MNISAKDTTFTRLNPFSGQIASRAAAMSVSEARRVADRVAAAQPAWASRGPGARRAALWRAADLMDERQPQLVAAMIAETGCTRSWAGFNIHLAVGVLREAASLTTQINGEIIPSDVPGSFAMVLREPAGVVLGIAPWNAPLILGARAVAVPLACGNGAILKASENCPETHRLLAEVIKDGGVGDALGLVTNKSEDAGSVVTALIDHEAVRRINFTGSTKIGRIIAQQSAHALKPILLELGGKAPMIVLDDADLDAAVDAAVFGSFMNAGQICMSTERIIVDQRIADTFVTAFARRAAALRVGAPDDEANQVAGLIGMAAANHVKDLIDDALAKGGVLAAGGDRDGTVISPAVVDHVTTGTRLYHEESFGPVAAIIRVCGDEEAISRANDTHYGLSASIFSQDQHRALAVARQLRSGMCHINGPTVHDEAQMPFGGMGESGYGRFGGRAGIDAFTELRWITMQTGKRHYPI